jgi:hypothetical protein
MPKYCIDTSGLSHPYEELPEDIFDSLWKFVRAKIAEGIFAVTREIFDEMERIDGGLGKYISENKDTILYEVNQGDWDWRKYLATSSAMTTRHQAHISEFSGGSPRTICLNDLSIIALADTLGLPVISMEARILDLAQTPKRKIPNICDAENIVHYNFNEFLRLEGYRK